MMRKSEKANAHYVMSAFFAIAEEIYKDMRDDGKIHEECAVYGVSLNVGEAAGFVYNGLLSLQHRGQEGAGIAIARDNRIICEKDVGLVSEVFSGDALFALSGANAAVGHARYSTTGSNTRLNAGPFVTEYLTGRIATAHNGNITNAREIRESLRSHGLNFKASSDSEVISSLAAFAITREGDALRGVIRAANALKGAFSLIILTGDGTLIAVRDPGGYRPLCVGKGESGAAVASESCALDATGFAFESDVAPGEVVVIKNGRVTERRAALANRAESSGLCIFEYVYFARPDSIIDNLSVYEARYNMGATLAEEHPADADAVCGVPDSGIEAAMGYSARSGIPLAPGFVKNRYIGRSFIYPSQAQREGAVRLKLNPLAANVRGKRIVLVDDSIVRGTTSGKIVGSLLSAGAKEVHVRISSPPFRHACRYGTDIDDAESLIANNMENEQIREKIGARTLGYISMDGLKKACAKCALGFCTECFTGWRAQGGARKHILE